MADRESQNVDRSDEYRGMPGRTRQEAMHYSCAECSHLFGAAVYSAINVTTDPDLGEQLSRGELNVLRCPACDTVATPAVPLIYHDPSTGCFALLLPENLRHEELRLRAQVIESLMGDPSDIPDYVRRADVVFGTTGLLRLLDRVAENAPEPAVDKDEREREQRELEEKRIELEHREEAILAREEDLQSKQEDLVTERAKLGSAREELSSAWADLERERDTVRALALELEARKMSPPKPPPLPPAKRKSTEVAKGARSTPASAAEVTKPAQVAEPAQAAVVAVADAADAADDEARAQPIDMSRRPADEVDAWRASEAPTRIIRHDDRIFLLARTGGELLEELVRAEPELRIQILPVDGWPVVHVVALPHGAAHQAAAERALYWSLDPRSDDGEAVLEQLAGEFSVTVDLFDDEARPVGYHEITAPLAGNAAIVRDRARELASEREDGEGELKQALESYAALGDERLGKKQHNFSADSFNELASPAATRLAVGIVGYWSDADNVRYLLEVKSFPLVYWKAIRARVVRRAVEYGLRLPPVLFDVALELELGAGRAELLRTMAGNFAEVSLRIKPSDLDPQQELENWNLLLADCSKESVTVDPALEELAAAAARRAGAVVDEKEPGGDVALLKDDELLELLSDRSQARDAALELCERGDAEFAEPIYRALCNMTRAEVARVLPAMMHVGRPAVPLLVRGLRHRKSFIRQGCALGLGSLKATEGIAPLLEMLLAEPSNVWKEASRALGDMGPLALGALIAGVKTADAEGRERIAWALAQSALDPKCLEEVRAMVRGRDTRLARVARRAMDLAVQVRSYDQEVRGQRPMRDQTIVRSFSRQFFECMGNDVAELGEEDILDQEEVLDDTDILDEAVEVAEDDIL